MVESYRNEPNCSTSNAGRSPPKSLFHTSEWIWLYNHFGYTGDYEFIYFE